MVHWRIWSPPPPPQKKIYQYTFIFGQIKQHHTVNSQSNVMFLFMQKNVMGQRSYYLLVTFCKNIDT